MKIFLKLFLILFLSTIFLFSGNLTSKYKQMMNTTSIEMNSTTTSDKEKSIQQIPNKTNYNLVNKIKKVQALKQGTFESSSEFNTRREQALLELKNKVKFFAHNASSEYSAGTAKMKSYDADRERMQLSLKWNKDLQDLLPDIKKLQTVSLNISRGEAKKLFSEKKTHYFHIEFTYKQDKLSISKMGIYDQFELYSTTKTTEVKKKTKTYEPYTKPKPLRTGGVSKQITGKTQIISFNENGINIKISYPNIIKPGEKFTIKVQMTNNYSQAKQGGLTLSFPDMQSMNGSILYNNFSTIKGYGYPDKIYNKQARKAIPANYFMVEGWQSKKWSKGRTKSFSVEFVAPYNIKELRVNARAVLWIRNKHDIREIPYHGLNYDQQGFAVKQFTIHITN